MLFLAHRGLWNMAEEKNTRHALQQAFQAGFGTETDIRDLDGKLVVSHDMPRNGALSLNIMLSDYVRAGCPGMLALNIKSDGLTASLRQSLAHHGITNYFCFDMSVPDMQPYLQAGMPVAARLSEYEAEGPLSRLAGILWWDAFNERFPPVDRLAEWLSRGQRVCLVSPELHGRSPETFWQRLASLPERLRYHNNLVLCTDLPERAREVLG